MTDLLHGQLVTTALVVILYMLGCAGIVLRELSPPPTRTALRPRRPPITHSHTIRRHHS